MKRKIAISALLLCVQSCFGSASSVSVHSLEQIKAGAKRFCDKIAVLYSSDSVSRQLHAHELDALKLQCKETVNNATTADDLNDFVNQQKKIWNECLMGVQRPMLAGKKLAPTQRQINQELNGLPTFSLYGHGGNQIPQLVKWIYDQHSFKSNKANRLLSKKLGEQAIAPKPKDSLKFDWDYPLAREKGFTFDTNNRFRAGEFVIFPRSAKKFTLAMILGRLRSAGINTIRREIVVDEYTLDQSGSYLLISDIDLFTGGYIVRIVEPVQIGKMTSQAKEWLVEKFSQ